MLFLVRTSCLRTSSARPGRFLFCIMTASFQFAVLLSILRTVFVPSLPSSPTPSGYFQQTPQGVPVPGVVCSYLRLVLQTQLPSASTHGCSRPVLAIAALQHKSPVVVIAGFVPLFFDNATIGVYAEAIRSGLRAVLTMPLSSQVFSFSSLSLAGLAWLHTVDTLACGTGQLSGQSTGFMKFLSLQVSQCYRSYRNPKLSTIVPNRNTCHGG